MSARLRIFIHSIIMVLLISIRPESGAQIINDHPDQDSISLARDFFDKDEVVELKIEFDLKEFQRTRKEEEYHPAVLHYTDDFGQNHSFKVKLRTRGIFRKSYCYLPPFWINIENSGVDTHELEDIKKMKVVTHCMKQKDFQDYVLKEYLAYKIYNIISPYSFKVRLLHITYIDTGRSKREMQGWAFVIEPIELLARRVDARIVENEELAMARMNAGIMDRLALYYYMIGNTDFSITGMHNVKIIMLNQPGPTGYIPIPYDFDFTGFVNALYARPAENVPIEKVTERYFLGMCRTDAIYKLVIDEFKGNSKEVHQLLQSFEYMNIDQKIEMLLFLEEFHNEIADEAFIDKYIRPTCR